MLAGFWSNVERATAAGRDLEATPSMKEVDVIKVNRFIAGKRVLAGFWTNIMRLQPEKQRRVDKRRMPHENFNKMREFDDSLDPFNDHHDVAQVSSKRGMAFDCAMLSKVMYYSLSYA